MDENKTQRETLNIVFKMLRTALCFIEQFRTAMRSKKIYAEEIVNRGEKRQVFGKFYVKSAISSKSK